MMTVETTHPRKAFGERLKVERERRGTSLAHISDATKVNASLLEGLERGDASRWPKGIYRRSFFRDYLAAIGLPAEPYVAEFLELFPDGEGSPFDAAPARPAAAAPAAVLPAAAAVNGSAPPLRLTFEAGASARWQRGWSGGAEPTTPPASRVASAAIDLAVVAGVAGLAALAPSITFWTALAAAACIYYPIGTIVGCTLGSAAGSTIAGRYRQSGSGRATQRLSAASSNVWQAVTEAAAAALERTRDWGTTLGALAGSLPAREGPTDPEVAELRRRRVEQAKRSSDEIEAIG